MSPAPRIDVRLIEPLYRFSTGSTPLPEGIKGLVESKLGLVVDVSVDRPRYYINVDLREHYYTPSLLASMIIQMICNWLGWERSEVKFTGWEEDPNELSQTLDELGRLLANG